MIAPNPYPPQPYTMTTENRAQRRALLSLRLSDALIDAEAAWQIYKTARDSRASEGQAEKTEKALEDYVEKLNQCESINQQLNTLEA